MLFRSPILIFHRPPNVLNFFNFMSFPSQTTLPVDKLHVEVSHHKLFFFCDGQDALTIPLVVVTDIHGRLIKYIGTTISDLTEHRNNFLS